VRRVDGGFEVRHFPDRYTRTPCCTVRVRPEAGESDIEALARADRMCEERHEDARGRS
jgi:hypothetical protein